MTTEHTAEQIVAIAAAAATAATEAALGMLRPQIQGLKDDIAALTTMVKQLEESISQHVAESTQEPEIWPQYGVGGGQDVPRSEASRHEQGPFTGVIEEE